MTSGAAAQSPPAGPNNASSPDAYTFVQASILPADREGGAGLVEVDVS